MNRLATFVDALDPYAPGFAGETEWLGPTLSLLALRTFDDVRLFAAPADRERAESLAAALRAAHPRTGVLIEPLAGAPDAARVMRSLQSEGGGVWTANAGAGTPVQRALWHEVARHLPLALMAVEPRRDPFSPAPVVMELSAGLPREDGGVREGGAYRVQKDPTHVERAASRDTTLPVGLEEALREAGVCGEDPAFRRALEVAAAVAPHQVPVLIGGETGTGKGVLARLIHAMSGRPADRWVALNCAAMPETLAESLLFGHKKGAFTGAASDQPGKFELADGGTLFLDEIGELTLPLQAKLLKVLEDGLVEPIGARQPRQVNVRIIAATNRDLAAAVAAREFREDLFYRLSFAQVALPPLRERRGDIQPLALQIVARINTSLRSPRCLSAAALRRLESLPWRGNIRDLENVIGRSLLLCRHDVVDADDLQLASPGSPPPADVSHLPEPREGFCLETYLADMRRALIQRALVQAGGNQSAAARLLGLTPQAVHKFAKDGSPSP